MVLTSGSLGLIWCENLMLEAMPLFYHHEMTATKIKSQCHEDNNPERQEKSLEYL